MTNYSLIIESVLKVLLGVKDLNCQVTVIGGGGCSFHAKLVSGSSCTPTLVYLLNVQNAVFVGILCSACWIALRGSWRRDNAPDR